MSAFLVRLDCGLRDLRYMELERHFAPNGGSQRCEKNQKKTISCYFELYGEYGVDERKRLRLHVHKEENGVKLGAACKRRSRKVEKIFSIEEHHSGAFVLSAVETLKSHFDMMLCLNENFLPLEQKSVYILRHGDIIEGRFPKIPCFKIMFLLSNDVRMKEPQKSLLLMCPEHVLKNIFKFLTPWEIMENVVPVCRQFSQLMMGGNIWTQFEFLVTDAFISLPFGHMADFFKISSRYVQKLTVEFSLEEELVEDHVPFQIWLPFFKHDWSKLKILEIETFDADFFIKDIRPEFLMGCSKTFTHLETLSVRCLSFGNELLHHAESSRIVFPKCREVFLRCSLEKINRVNMRLAFPRRVQLEKLHLNHADARNKFFTFVDVTRPNPTIREFPVFLRSGVLSSLHAYQLPVKLDAKGWQLAQKMGVFSNLKSLGLNGNLFDEMPSTVDKDKIFFPKLKSLWMEEASPIKSVHHVLLMPSLEKLWIRNVPEESVKPTQRVLRSLNIFNTASEEWFEKIKCIAADLWETSIPYSRMSNLECAAIFFLHKAVNKDPGNIFKELQCCSKLRGLILNLPDDLQLETVGQLSQPLEFIAFPGTNLSRSWDAFRFIFTECKDSLEDLWIQVSDAKVAKLIVFTMSAFLVRLDYGLRDPRYMELERSGPIDGYSKGYEKNPRKTVACYFERSEREGINARTRFRLHVHKQVNGAKLGTPCTKQLSLEKIFFIEEDSSGSFVLTPVPTLEHRFNFLICINGDVLDVDVKPVCVLKHGDVIEGMFPTIPCFRFVFFLSDERHHEERSHQHSPLLSCPRRVLENIMKYLTPFEAMTNVVPVCREFFMTMRNGRIWTHLEFRVLFGVTSVPFGHMLDFCKVVSGYVRKVSVDFKVDPKFQTIPSQDMLRSFFKHYGWRKLEVLDIASMESNKDVWVEFMFRSGKSLTQLKTLAVRDLALGNLLLKMPRIAKFMLPNCREVTLWCEMELMYFPFVDLTPCFPGMKKLNLNHALIQSDLFSAINEGQPFVSHPFVPAFPHFIGSGLLSSLHAYMLPVKLDADDWELAQNMGIFENLESLSLNGYLFRHIPAVRNGNAFLPKMKSLWLEEASPMKLVHHLLLMPSLEKLWIRNVHRTSFAGHSQRVLRAFRAFNHCSEEWLSNLKCIAVDLWETSIPYSKMVNLECVGLFFKDKAFNKNPGSVFEELQCCSKLRGLILTLPDDLHFDTLRKWSQPLEFIAFPGTKPCRALSALLCMTQVQNSLEDLWIEVYNSKAYVGCTWGIENIGYVFMVGKAMNAFGSGFSGLIVEYTGRIPVFLAAFLLNVATLAYLLIWEPTMDEHYVLFIMSGAYMLADSVWQTQINGLHGLLFHENVEAAFSAYKVFESLGFIIAYFFSKHLCVRIKLYALVFILTLGMVCYGVLESRERKREVIAKS
ncbi:unnamed protein product [Notodromas monacha]|uniref:F-box domain-containing protein n=1 Tax=Notodromas monacha TaxID=399045 RepID=A0A7R9BZF2_9CRUS|nr:unnamed protein product [Notodromas monacha]CAG0923509.1 unnamed protein product [Notodromas monacha]